MALLSSRGISTPSLRAQGEQRRFSYFNIQRGNPIDRPLDRAAQEALRSISSRAKITATSFTNHYEWGDFKGDPREFMERWFDLHLYLANWGTRRFMMRVPERLLRREDVERFVRDPDRIGVWTFGESLIVDAIRDDVETDDQWDEEWDEGSGWLAALAPLRADVASGDLRLFYLAWLMAVEKELVQDDEVEPLPGIGPLSGALEAFAGFFGIDPDLVQAAAEGGTGDATIPEGRMREALAGIGEDEKTELLLRVIEGDGHVAAELKRRIRERPATPGAAGRTVGALRGRAREIAAARDRAEAERREAERRREAALAEEARRVRLAALKHRGAKVWQEIETEIARRNPSGYDRATSLLSDLQALAVEEGSQDDFDHRLESLRARHGSKGRFIERLTKLAS
jgi:hypothetical protein